MKTAHLLKSGIAACAMLMACVISTEVHAQAGVPTSGAVADKDHMSLEWYENQGSGEKKTMEINYTRAGKAEGSSKR